MKKSIFEILNVPNDILLLSSFQLVDWATTIRVQLDYGKTKSQAVLLFTGCKKIMLTLYPDEGVEESEIIDVIDFVFNELEDKTSAILVTTVFEVIIEYDYLKVNLD